MINFLLTTEIIPLCLRIMESGSELSKTVATFILQKILLDETGLSYICQTFERFSHVSTVLVISGTPLIRYSLRFHTYWCRLKWCRLWLMNLHHDSWSMLSAAISVSLITQGTSSSCIHVHVCTRTVDTSLLWDGRKCPDWWGALISMYTQCTAKSVSL